MASDCQNFRWFFSSWLEGFLSPSHSSNKVKLETSQEQYKFFHFLRLLKEKEIEIKSRYIKDDLSFQFCLYLERQVFFILRFFYWFFFSDLKDFFYFHLMLSLQIWIPQCFIVHNTWIHKWNNRTSLYFYICDVGNTIENAFYLDLMW